MYVDLHMEDEKAATIINGYDEGCVCDASLV